MVYDKIIEVIASAKQDGFDNDEIVVYISREQYEELLDGTVDASDVEGAVGTIGGPTVSVNDEKAVSYEAQ